MYTFRKTMIKKIISIFVFATIFLNLAFFAKADTKITSNTVTATPKSETTMHLKWFTGQTGNVFLIYKKDSAEVSVLASCNDATPLPNTVNTNRECQLTLNDLTPGNIYMYKFQEGVLVENNYSSYFVMPVKSNNTEVTDLTDVSAKISWTSEKEQNAKIVYYPKVNEAVKKEIIDQNFSKTHSFSLTKLVPLTTYVYQVTSLDQEGGGTITDFLEFSTLPKSKSKIDLEISGVDYITSENNAENKDSILVDFVVSYKVVSSLSNIELEAPFTISIESGPTSDYPAPDVWKASSLTRNGKSLVGGQEYKERIGAYLLKKGTMLDANFSFTVDSNNNVEEFDEENNLFEKRIVVDGTPNASKITEQVKCIFNGSKIEQKCYLAGDNDLFTCSGIGSCVMDVKKAKNEEVTWKSTCGGYSYTYMDGVNEYANFSCDAQSISINGNSKLLVEDKLDEILDALKQLRDEIKEQRNLKKYFGDLKKDIWVSSKKMESALNNFITYGVDANTKMMGEGERAAVAFSYKAAFSKLPETEMDLIDAIKIASGRFPANISDEAEKKAKSKFFRIFSRVPDMEVPTDAAAVKVMAYGLRQKAENRNMKSETVGIKTFKHIFGNTPKTTEEWNAMQAITYSGAKKKADSDKDGLADETEAKFGTNPNDSDTDGDGFKDGSEVLYGFDPLRK